jgi:hypothetical protein
MGLIGGAGIIEDMIWITKSFQILLESALIAENTSGTVFLVDSLCR